MHTTSSKKHQLSFFLVVSLSTDSSTVNIIKYTSKKKREKSGDTLKKDLTEKRSIHY